MVEIHIKQGHHLKKKKHHNNMQIILKDLPVRVNKKSGGMVERTLQKTTKIYIIH